MDKLKIERIEDAIKSCDSQPNCVECVKTYKIYDGTTPCNNIRKFCGESIWWYKKDSMIRK